MIQYMLTAAYLGSLGIVIWSVFCRLVQTDQSTHIEARATFWFLGTAAAYGVFATLFWGHTPQLEDAMLAASVAFTQVLSSRLWRFGVPRSYGG